MKKGDSVIIKKKDSDYYDEYGIIVSILGDRTVCIRLMDGWGEQVCLKENELELVDQTNKWTILFYSGSGAFLTPIEVTAEDEEDAIKIATEKVYKETEEGGQYIDTLDEVLKLQDDKDYKKDFEEYKLKREVPDLDFLQFLEEYYEYMYVDTPNYGVLYIIHAEHLKIRKGWGVVANSYREDEKLFG